MTDAQLTSILLRHVNEIAKKDIRHVALDADINSLGIDSLVMLEVISAMEKDVGARVPDSRLFEIRVVGDLFHLLRGERADGDTA